MRFSNSPFVDLMFWAYLWAMFKVIDLVKWMEFL
jgi:hypothetical protein